VRGFSAELSPGVEVDAEVLNLGRIGDEPYLNDLSVILNRKHKEPRPQLIIPTGTPALKFLLEHRESLFSDVPIVFLDPDSRLVSSLPLPPDITGVASYRDFAGTLELALQVHPATRQVAVVVGAGPIGQGFERGARQALKPFEDRVEFLWLKGMPLDELTEALHRLPRDSVILYLMVLEDRTGKSYVPASVTEALSSAANAPIYGLWDTLIGHGVVGGRMVRFETDGFLAAGMALRVLHGEAPSTVPVVDRRHNDAILDGRELARWGVDADQLPAGVQVLYRQPSLWGEYRAWIVGAGLLITVQVFWILALSLSRSRMRRVQAALKEENALRQVAETTLMRQRSRLEQYGKERGLGVMATAIAHEINQPLIANQNYLHAARQRLRSGTIETKKLEELLEKAGNQAGRVGDIIQHIRNLVTRDTPDLHPAALRPIIEQAVQVVESDVETLRCKLKFGAPLELPEVLVDELQIQLVVVNLLRNALRVVEGLDNRGDRIIEIRVHASSDREVEVAVVDRGPGIPPDRVSEIFEAFVSDTGGGMGMGLAICRLIVEAHGGHIWYEPNPGGGAILRFTLRVVGDIQA